MKLHRANTATAVGRSKIRLKSGSAMTLPAKPITPEMVIERYIMIVNKSSVVIVESSFNIRIV